MNRANEYIYTLEDWYKRMDERCQYPVSRESELQRRIDVGLFIISYSRTVSDLIYGAMLLAHAGDGLYDFSGDYGNRTPAEIIRDALLSHIVMMLLLAGVDDRYDDTVALCCVGFDELHYDSPLFLWCPDV